MKSRLYLETTIVSYLTAWPSRELVMQANQQLTQEWWTRRRESFDLYISQVVMEEASAGDLEAARKRMEILSPIPKLEITDDAESLAVALVEGMKLPERAKADALHIAISAVNGIDFLLTWNCRHIANAVLRPRIERICRDAECEPPVICTPQELLEREDQHA